MITSDDMENDLEDFSHLEKEEIEKCVDYIYSDLLDLYQKAREIYSEDVVTAAIHYLTSEEA